MVYLSGIPQPIQNIKMADNMDETFTEDEAFIENEASEFNNNTDKTQHINKLMDIKSPIQNDVDKKIEQKDVKIETVSQQKYVLPGRRVNTIFTLGDKGKQLEYLIQVTKVVNTSFIQVEDLMKRLTPVCQSYGMEGSPTFHRSRQLMHLWGNQTHITNDDVTLVTQLSASRLYMLARVAKHWHGPMSVALSVTPPEFWNLSQTFNEIRYKALIERGDIDIHIVIEKGVSHIYLCRVF